MDDIKILLFSKKQNIFCDYAEAILKSYFKNDEVVSVRGGAEDRLDDELYWYRAEYIISFVSPWIIPKSILTSAKKAAINFIPVHLIIQEQAAITLHFTKIAKNTV